MPQAFSMVFNTFRVIMGQNYTTIVGVVKSAHQTKKSVGLGFQRQHSNLLNFETCHHRSHPRNLWVRQMSTVGGLLLELESAR
jgi:hypothetical protein